MNTTSERPEVAGSQQTPTAVGRGRLRFILPDAALIVVGIIALGSLVVASLATAVTIGVLLVIGGTVEAIGAFWDRGRNSVTAHLLAGVLSIVVGALILWAPADAVLALTLLLTCLLIAGGAFKIIAALNVRSEARVYPPVSGVVDAILGFLIWLEWPASALWVLGLFVGTSLVFRGVNWIGLGLALRGQPPTA